MRSVLSFISTFVVALALAHGALGAPPSLLAPSQGATVGAGAALIDVRVATKPVDQGSAWGWRVVASTDPAVVAHPAPFAQLDYWDLNSELGAIRNDYAARGMLYSSFYEQAVRNAKDRFFGSGLSADFHRKPVAYGAGVATAVGGTHSGTSAQMYLDRPGTWHIAVATATEWRVEWSAPVAVTVAQATAVPVPPPAPAPSPAPSPPPAPVSPPAPALAPPAPAPALSPAKPAARKVSARCRTIKKKLATNARQLKRARVAAKKAKRPAARRATRAKVKRLSATRARMIVAHRRAC